MSTYTNTDNIHHDFR